MRKVAGLSNLPATLIEATILHGCFSHYLNCTNGTKSHETSHINLKFIHPIEKCFLDRSLAFISVVIPSFSGKLDSLLA